MFCIHIIQHNDTYSFSTKEKAETFREQYARMYIPDFELGWYFFKRNYERGIKTNYTDDQLMQLFLEIECYLYIIHVTK